MAVVHSDKLYRMEIEIIIEFYYVLPNRFQIYEGKEQHDCVGIEVDTGIV